MENAEIASRLRDAALELVGGAQVRARALGPEAAAGTGGAITLWAESATGLLGASRRARGRSGADLPGAGAGGSSFAVREVSSHARTTMWLLEQFLDARWRVRRD